MSTKITPAPSSAPNAWTKPLQPVDPALRARYLSLLLTLTGQKVTLTLVNQHTYTGILHTATPVPPFQFVLKATQSSTDDKFSDGNTLVIDAKQVVSLHCKSVKEDRQMQRGAFSDAEIANTVGKKTGEKELEKADASWTVPSKVDLKGDIGNWDQFEANKQLFNVKATYDENLYTTQLDKSKISQDQMKHAERLAKEIESSTSTNIHLAEERNQAIQTDFDEEDRYSGVLKMNYAKAAKPPATATPAAPPGMGAPAETKTAAEAKPAEATPKPKEPENEAAVSTPSTTTTTKTTPPTTEEKAEKEAEKPKTKLNPNAKEFTFNAGAPAFVPGGAPPPPPQPVYDPYMMQPPPHMYYPGYYPQQYGYGMPPPNMHPPQGYPPYPMQQQPYQGGRGGGGGGGRGGRGGRGPPPQQQQQH